MFKNRSGRSELLDEDNIPADDLYRNLRELNIINRYLGGYKLTLASLKNVLQQGKEYTLVDIGSGGGDTLKCIQKWNKKQNYSLKLYGIDLKEICVDYAKMDNNSTINFICDDYRNALNHIPRIDIMHASLFCHHLKNDDIITLINYCISNNITLVINDLERNPIAYYAIKLLTTLFSNSYLVKNDAPLSVLRGFKLSEWRKLIESSTATRYSLNSRWAFRHQIVIYAD